MTVKDMLKPVVVLFLICLLTTAALAGTNALTKDIIAENARAEEVAARQRVLPEAVDFREQDTYVEGLDASGAVAGYVFVTETKGYGGTIRVMTGIDISGTVTGVSILEHSETVGLGANTAKPAFTDQYKKAAPEGGFQVVKGAASADREISAVTSATISSRAVTRAVNDALEQYNSLKGGA